MDPSRTVLIASDAHLGSTSPEQEAAFFTWLDQGADAASWIILNGDVFDFWFEYRWGTTRGHDERLRRLRAVVDQGVRVTLMGGNHDWWGGPWLREHVGVEFLQEPLVADLGGRRCYVTHGDGLGSGDTIYRWVVRPMLHSAVTRFAFGMLPPAIGDRIAGGVSETDHRWGPPGEGERRAAGRLVGWATRFLEGRPDIECVLAGHCHVPSLEEHQPGQWYINSGDWVHHRSYVVLEEGHTPRLEHWDGTIR